VHPELLIVKQTADGFVPLDETDKANNGNRIADVLLKYQWPMCIATPLSEQEQDALLTADIPFAEENFIETKLRQIDDTYRVVFIPTTLYELFTMVQLFGTKDQQNPLQTATAVFQNEAVYNKEIHKDIRNIQLSKILKSASSPQQIRGQINTKYRNINNFFLQ
jgi:hypothetical protein